MSKGQPEDHEATRRQEATPQSASLGLNWLRHSSGSEASLIDSLILAGRSTIDEISQAVWKFRGEKPGDEAKSKKRTNDHLRHLRLSFDPTKVNGSQTPGHGFPVPTDSQGRLSFFGNKVQTAPKSRPRDWSQEEVRATVSDYLSMLNIELNGGEINKKRHRDSLRPSLNNRTDGAIEFKHQNISAVLAKMSLPFIKGYKPAYNFQGILEDVVREMLSEREWLQNLMSARSDSDQGDQLEKTGDRDETLLPSSSGQISPERHFTARIVDFAEQHERNSALGLEGETFVLESEKQRLSDAGREDLSKQVVHSSVVLGDGLGYDIASFEVDGRQRFIEVKTTNGDKNTAFYLSDNEIDFSLKCSDKYHLYRVYSFSTSPSFYVLSGPLPQSCSLTPAVYRAQPKEIVQQLSH